MIVIVLVLLESIFFIWVIMILFKNNMLFLLFMWGIKCWVVNSFKFLWWMWINVLCCKILFVCKLNNGWKNNIKCLFLMYLNKCFLLFVNMFDWVCLNGKWWICCYVFCLVIVNVDLVSWYIIVWFVFVW